MKEREFQDWVIQVAELHGWKVWHVGTPMRPVGMGQFVPEKRGRGLPDLIMLHEDPPRVIFAEVKNESGTISVEQKEFLRIARDIGVETARHEWTAAGALDAVPVQAFLWRPANRDLIEAVLSAR